MLPWVGFVVVVVVVLVWFGLVWFFRATPLAYGSSQARD